MKKEKFLIIVAICLVVTVVATNVIGDINYSYDKSKCELNINMNYTDRCYDIINYPLAYDSYKVGVTGIGLMLCGSFLIILWLANDIYETYKRIEQRNYEFYKLMSEIDKKYKKKIR